MSDVIWVAGIRFPKTCGNYKLFKSEVRAAPVAGRSPQFVLRYAADHNRFTLFLYRVEQDAQTGRLESVVSQLDRSAATIATLGRTSGQTASPPVNLRARAFAGNFVDRVNEAGVAVREYTFIREFYGTFIKVRMTGAALEDVLATIGILDERIDINTADMAIPTWKIDAQTGPFGLRWGSKPSELQLQGIQLLPLQQTATTIMYGAAEIQGDPGARSFIMEFDKVTGLRSVWAGYFIYDDAEGSRLRAKVEELEPVLSETYTDCLYKIQVNFVDADFYRGLRAQKGHFRSMAWKNRGSPVIVLAAAAEEPLLAGQPIGCITIQYRAELAANANIATGPPNSGQAKAPVAQPDVQQSTGNRRSWRAVAITIGAFVSFAVIRGLLSSGTGTPTLNTAEEQQLIATVQRGAECLHLSDRKDGNVVVSELLRAGRDCPTAAPAASEAH